jgi:arylsulfatase A-like enzyme
VFASAKRPGTSAAFLLAGALGLRADHLGCYGYERPTSAWMDEVAAAGVRFENCSAQAPWSLPSLFALMTGEFPSVFWVDQAMNERPRRCCSPLPTLAAVLRHDAFHTAAITDGGPLKPEWGVFQGFDTFVVTQTPGIEDTCRHAADWVRAHARDRFFLFVQSSEACLSHPPGLFSTGDGGQQAEAVARYDAGVARADLLVGLLQRELEGLGIKDKTLVIITSAHGQDFSELAAGPDGPVGRFGHGLGQALLHVPLIVRAPGLLPAGKVVKNRVAAIDVTPTVLALLGIEQPGSAPGRSLKPLIEGAEGSEQEMAVYSEATTWGPEQKALVFGRYKMVFVPRPWKDMQEGERHARSPGDESAKRQRLFDLPQMRFYGLENDPQEQDDVSGSHADLVARYRAALMLIMNRNRELRAGYKSALVEL